MNVTMSREVAAATACHRAIEELDDRLAHETAHLDLDERDPVLRMIVAQLESLAGQWRMRVAVSATGGQ